MTQEQIEQFFEDNYNYPFPKFSDIKPERLRHRRPDMNVFLLADDLSTRSRLARGEEPESGDIIAGASHDEFYLAVGLEDLDLATEEDLLDLLRCGAFIREDGLCMFA